MGRRRVLGGVAAAAMLAGCGAGPGRSIRETPGPTAAAPPPTAAPPTPPAAPAVAPTLPSEPAAEPANSPAPAGTAAPSGPVFPFSRGVNVDDWFLRSYFDEQLDGRDFELMRQLGFSFVRLPLDPEFFSTEAGISPDIRLVERVVDRLASSGLATLLDPHPDDLAMKRRLMDGEAAALARYERFLEGLAGRFASRGRRWVALELMNEPHDSAGRWEALQRRLLDAARRGGPELTVVLTGEEWSSVSGLTRLAPLSDGNVAYTFHFYEPHEFTHQGATWGKPVWRHMRGVPYPGTPERVAAALARADEELRDPAIRAEVRAELQAYGSAGWDGARIAREVGRVAAWARRHGAVVVCGELGVYRRDADPADRDRWLRDVRLALEEQGIGWALWEYHRGFGLVEPGSGGRRPVASMVTALGLNPIG